MSTTPTVPIDQINNEIIARDEARRTRRPLTSLANPGEINREVCEALSRHVTPDDIGRVIHHLITATRPCKSGELPDARAMEAGAKLWLAYRAGLPVQRTETVNVNLDAEESDKLEERLAKSPALRRSLARMLAVHAEADADG
jgi:hypothetical protein